MKKHKLVHPSPLWFLQGGANQHQTYFALLFRRWPSLGEGDAAACSDSESDVGVGGEVPRLPLSYVSIVVFLGVFPFHFDPEREEVVGTR